MSIIQVWKMIEGWIRARYKRIEIGHQMKYKTYEILDILIRDRPFEWPQFS